MQTAENLVRKQYLISPSQVEKLDILAKEQNVSAAALVRQAIDAFNPNVPADIEESELLELVSSRVKEAIIDTQKTHAKLKKTLAALSTKKGKN